MRKIKEVFRLANLYALSERQISRGIKIKKSMVQDNLFRANSAITLCGTPGSLSPAGQIV